MTARAVTVYALPNGASVTLWHVAWDAYRVEDSTGHVARFAYIADAAAYAIRRKGILQALSNTQANAYQEHHHA